MFRSKFKCFKCESEWEDNHKPGPCIYCGHDYVHWMNYVEYREWQDKENLREKMKEVKLL